MAEGDVVWVEEPPTDATQTAAIEPGSSTSVASSLARGPEPSVAENHCSSMPESSQLNFATEPPEPLIGASTQPQPQAQRSNSGEKLDVSLGDGSEGRASNNAQPPESTNEPAPSGDHQLESSSQRSVRWADGVAKAEGKSDTNLQLDEFERKIRESNKEALGLVDRLSQLNSTETTSEAKSKVADKSAATPALEPPPPYETALANGWSSDLQVDSYRINPDLMRRPVDVVMLEGGKLFILDDETGATLLHLESKNTVVAKSFKAKWKNPKCACAVRGGKQEILVLAEYGSEVRADHTDGGAVENAQTVALGVVVDVKYDLQICRFDDQLHLVERVEAPKFLRDKVVVTCQLCHVSETNCVYLAASTTPNDTYLYELSPDCRWAEIHTVRGRTHSDIEPLAVIGPVTELLLVESNRQYVQLMSVYNSEVVAQRMIAVAERPDALSIDGKGNFFVFDKATSKVGLFSKVYFDKIRDVATVERAKCRISAFGGLLAVLASNFTELKVYKY